MGKVKHVIYLSEEEIEGLKKIIETEPPKTALRAKILLASDFNNPVYTSAQKLADSLGTTITTVQTVRLEYCTLGFPACILPKGTYSAEKRALITPEKRKTIIEMIKGAPPFGQRRWTIQSICDECMKRELFTYIAPTAIKKLLSEEKIDLLNPNKCSSLKYGRYGSCPI